LIISAPMGFSNTVSDNARVFSCNLWAATIKLLKAKEVHTIRYRSCRNPSEKSVGKCK